MIAEARKTNTAPRARINATDIFVLWFILRFQTRKIGRMAKVESETTPTADCAYIEFAMTVVDIHFPFAPANRIQKYDDGEHWKIRTNVKKIVESVINVITPHINFICILLMQIRIRKTLTLYLNAAEDTL